jgi:hypothetical protein
MRRLKDRLTYANVVSTLALFLVVTGGVVWAAKIGPRQIARDAVKAKHVRADAIGSAELAAGSVGTAELESDSVGTRELEPGGVGTDELAPASVDETKLSQNAVGPNSLQGNAVGSDQLAPDSVGTRELKAGAVEFENVAAGALSPRLFAHVNSSGVLAENSGNVEAAGRSSIGQYFVDFNRDLRGCVGVASVGFGFGPGVIGAGATAQVRMNLNNDASVVGVTVYRGGFTFNDVADSDVHLIIAC